jgi:glucan phosphoethanolaminetransferase (alkaline phosphatase superfamily)
MPEPAGAGRMRAMGLKLFRSTGYSSILAPGETRLPLHPAWMALAVSAWAGFVCNVAMWRGLRGSGNLAHGLVVGAAVMAVSLFILSLLGWRKTLKPAAILVLTLAALASSTIWGQAWPVDASLLARPASTIFVPDWPDLLRWQVSATLVGLALVPAIWVVQKPVRRLGGPQQLRVNVLGMVIAVALFAASAYLLERGL